PHQHTGTVGRLEVERDGTPASPDEEVGRSALVQVLRLLEERTRDAIDADDVGTEVAEHHRRVRNDAHAGQFDDANALEWPGTAHARARYEAVARASTRW